MTANFHLPSSLLMLQIRVVFSVAPQISRMSETNFSRAFQTIEVTFRIFKVSYSFMTGITFVGKSFKSKAEYFRITLTLRSEI